MTKNDIQKKFDDVLTHIQETTADIKAAFSEGAMPAGTRRLREAELIAGVVEMILAPAFSAGGAFMAADALKDLQDKGHNIRVKNKPRIRVYG